MIACQTTGINVFLATYYRTLSRRLSLQLYVLSEGQFIAVLAEQFQNKIYIYVHSKQVCLYIYIVCDSGEWPNC